MAAFGLALDMHVDCIEVDASRTQDGVLVALHDR
jgi:glycerophosphoryl diester phosphodiesterase